MKDKILKQSALLPSADKELFNQEFGDIVPIIQDKVPPQRRSGKNIWEGKRKNTANSKQIKQASASFVFSDGFEAYFNPDEKIKYVKPGSDTQAIKRLARGDYAPEYLLDLHGLKQEEAKLEIAALLFTAQKQQANCVNIMHGIGKHILKKSVPNWLIQHPNVLAFHQAPKEWGGKSALLVLLDVPSEFDKN
ncbi:MAG: endonuclease SmrB [Paraglaciecola sp.]|uniref:endonuclease SmrB n=1 Tax=Pseudomonadati TaxID=3379134 RepID=UPI00273E362A|nr:endonuclease SmrB [Paraglaciecola sp.]MDP5032651.1 endonuclease SmrB [Paraglaciecola sp.]MDP5041137.1 endonuclease SmrB [Paraglaciecola sp.]MDP5132454.1 endonuclease SmrB [Paraglaciecola sp.]